MIPTTLQTIDVKDCCKYIVNHSLTQIQVFYLVFKPPLVLKNLWGFVAFLFLPTNI